MNDFLVVTAPACDWPIYLPAFVLRASAKLYRRTRKTTVPKMASATTSATVFVSTLSTASASRPRPDRQRYNKPPQRSELAGSRRQQAEPDLDPRRSEPNDLLRPRRKHNNDDRGEDPQSTMATSTGPSLPIFWYRHPEWLDTHTG
jgi:hypothetical protein